LVSQVYMCTVTTEVLENSDVYVHSCSMFMVCFYLYFFNWYVMYYLKRYVNGLLNVPLYATKNDVLIFWNLDKGLGNGMNRFAIVVSTLYGLNVMFLK